MRLSLIELVWETKVMKVLRGEVMVSSSLQVWKEEGNETKGRFVINLRRQNKYWSKKIDDGDISVVVCGFLYIFRVCGANRCTQATVYL